MRGWEIQGGRRTKSLGIRPRETEAVRSGVEGAGCAAARWQGSNGTQEVSLSHGGSQCSFVKGTQWPSVSQSLEHMLPPGFPTERPIPLFT